VLIDGVPADTHSICDFIDGLAFGELLTDRSGRWAELLHGDPDVGRMACLMHAGKTTMLEFVRYALDALPSREEQPIERRRIESLVEKIRFLQLLTKHSRGSKGVPLRKPSRSSFEASRARSTTGSLTTRSGRCQVNRLPRFVALLCAPELS
jgi:hypothetical protein